MSTPPAGGPPDRVVILGLGLIGGSLARDLAALDVPVAAADLDPARVTAALYEGVVRESLDPRAPELRARDLVVLAVPVGAAPELVRHLAPLLPPDAVLTDVGSTKRDIVAAARAAGIPGRFVGAHPMAGSHTAGWSASRQGLFRDARVWLCPAAASAEAHHRVRAMWESVGARPEIVDPDD
ncbi:MAG TPA: prephenate dehydrogenase/arogenate dehydrogenase family protein, partial [Longimicrobiales bacterium]|nr:prephenate dehydrogenase/arogenate dehydrogenase family protein [Longimicrobiales bacterium]